MGWEGLASCNLLFVAIVMLFLLLHSSWAVGTPLPVNNGIVLVLVTMCRGVFSFSPWHNSSVRTYVTALTDTLGLKFIAAAELHGSSTSTCAHSMSDPDPVVSSACYAA